MGLAPSTDAHLEESKSTPSQNNTTGEIGETFALEYLQGKRFNFIERNWKCKLGEIDLIFQDNDTVVFVEVKTRIDSTLAAKNIFNNITWKKQKKLKQLAQVYLLKKFRDNARPLYRIDIVGVILSMDKSNTIAIDHICNAISNDDY